MPPDRSRKPEWTPDDGGEAFAARVLPGVAGGHDGLPSLATDADATPGVPAERPTRRPLSEDEYCLLYTSRCV